MPDTKNEFPLDTQNWSYYGYAEESAVGTLKRLEGICKAIKAKRRGTTGSDTLTLREICVDAQNAITSLEQVICALEREDRAEEIAAKKGKEAAK